MATRADTDVMPPQANEQQRRRAPYQKPGDRHGTDPFLASEATHTAHTWNLGISPPTR